MCALDTDAIRASGRCWIKYNANTCITGVCPVCVCVHMFVAVLCMWVCMSMCNKSWTHTFLLCEINMIHKLNLLILCFLLCQHDSVKFYVRMGVICACIWIKQTKNTNKCTRFTESCPFFHWSITPAKSLSLKSLDSLLACCIKHTTDKAIHFFNSVQYKCHLTRSHSRQRCVASSAVRELIPAHPVFKFNSKKTGMYPWHWRSTLLTYKLLKQLQRWLGRLMMDLRLTNNKNKCKGKHTDINFLNILSRNLENSVL